MELKQETSVGAVVYKNQNNNFYFLLVYSAKNKEWSFPKGHIEEGETEIETATREIFEETKIRKIKFIDNFKFVDSYLTKGVLPSTKGGIVKKNVIYYLCLTQQDCVNPNNNEISDCKWFSYTEAIRLLKFEMQHKLLKQVMNLLEVKK